MVLEEEKSKKKKEEEKSFETMCLYIAAQKFWVKRDGRYFPDKPTYRGFI